MHPPKHYSKCFGILTHNENTHIMFLFTNMKTRFWLWSYYCHWYILITYTIFIYTHTYSVQLFRANITFNSLNTYFDLTIFYYDWFENKYSFIFNFSQSSIFFVLYSLFNFIMISIFFTISKWKTHPKINDFPG